MPGNVAILSIVAVAPETRIVPVKPDSAPATDGDPPASSSVPVPVMLLSALKMNVPPVVLIVPLFSTRQGAFALSR